MSTHRRPRLLIFLSFIGLAAMLLSGRVLAQSAEANLLIGTWKLTNLEIKKAASAAKPDNGPKVKKVADKGQTAVYQFVDDNTLIITKEEPNSNNAKKLNYTLDTSSLQPILSCTTANGQQERRLIIEQITASSLTLLMQKGDGSTVVHMTFSRQ